MISNMCLNVVGVTSAYTINQDTDEFIDANASAGAFAVTLPPLSQTVRGQPCTVTKVDSSANAVTLATSSSSDTFLDGTTSKTVSTQWSYLRVICSVNSSGNKVWRII
jgi:hypothetical protein